MESLTELFCFLDDFCKTFESQWKQSLLEQGLQKRQRSTCLSLSEMMTFVILFHQLRYRQFKMFYEWHIRKFLHSEFPNAPSYQRCLELLPRCIVGLTALFEQVKGQCTGISIIDSTPLAVCDNHRIHSHKVFAGMAARGKSSSGWFFGFKLHAIINHRGELLNVCLTRGNKDDRKPVLHLSRGLSGKLLADRGYISKVLEASLLDQGIEFLVKKRQNMKAKPYSNFDKALLRKRSLIETVFDELKHLCQIEHTRHRSPANFVVNLMAGLIAYCLMPNKPTIRLYTNSISPS